MADWAGIEPMAAAVWGGPGKGGALKPGPAADEGADEQIEVVDELATDAEHQLGGAGGGDVVGEVDGPGAERGDLAADVDGAPEVELLEWSADLLMPRPHLVRRADTEAGDAGGEAGAEAGK